MGFRTSGSAAKTVTTKPSGTVMEAAASAAGIGLPFWVSVLTAKGSAAERREQKSEKAVRRKSVTY